MTIHQTPKPPINLSQHTLTAILWVDKTYHIIWANPSAEQLLSMSQSRLSGQFLFNIFCEDLNSVPQHSPSQTNHQQDKTLAEQFAIAEQQQQPFISHDQYIISGIETILLDYAVSPIEQNGQQFFLIEMWGKDRQSRITQEQKQQKQYQIARQMLRAIAHEVKNPLAGIRGATQLLEKKLSYPHQQPSQSQLSNNQLDTDKIFTYTNIIIKEADRLSALIGQMLGSNHPANWQSINIHEPLQHVLTLIQSQYPDIHIIRDYDLSLPNLMADNDQLIQIFLNLMQNACEAMLEHNTQANNHFNHHTKPPFCDYQTNQNQPYTPTLTICTRIEFQYTIANILHKQVLKISIIDNGCGIAPEHLEQIFFPLVTYRANGTGLGLALVQEMVSRHHGAISVQSKPMYTQFSIYLPFTQDIIE